MTQSSSFSARILWRNFKLFLRHGRQWWYWTSAWQAAEAEAEADIAAGRVTYYADSESFLRSLDER